MRAYYKYITPAILFFFLCVCLGYWTHHPRSAGPPAPPSASAQK